MFVIGKIRPQVLAVIAVLGLGIWRLIEAGAIGEAGVVLGATAGVALKILDSDSSGDDDSSPG